VPNYIYFGGFKIVPNYDEIQDNNATLLNFRPLKKYLNKTKLLYDKVLKNDFGSVFSHNLLILKKGD
jgi:hypothetical protein